LLWRDSAGVQEGIEAGTFSTMGVAFILFTEFVSFTGAWKSIPEGLGIDLNYQLNKVNELT
jgi:hypothetical protein